MEYIKKMEEGSRTHTIKPAEEHEDIWSDSPRNQSGHRWTGCVQILQGQMVDRDILRPHKAQHGLQRAEPLRVWDGAGRGIRDAPGRQNRPEDSFRRKERQEKR